MTALTPVLVRRRIHWRPTVVVAGLVVLAWVVAALFWPHLVPQDPALQVPVERFQAPDAGHWLGTDQFGRDVFARMLAGSRPVLIVAPLATALGVALGAAIGLTTGTLRGWVDDIVMRVLDAAMVFPAVIAAVLFVALLGHSTVVVVLVVAAAFVPIVARSIRAAALVERERPYVEAALLRGEAPVPLMLREILPNIRGTLLVEATSRLGDAIFAAATLSFLGLGQGPGSPEWGASVSENRVWLQIAPWTVLAPALAIGSLVIAVALLADVLRQRWDTR